MAGHNGTMGYTGVIGYPSGPTGPTGPHSLMGLAGNIGLPGATGVQGPPGPSSECIVISYRLVVKSEEELWFYISWATSYTSSNLLYTQISASMYQHFSLTKELPLKHYLDMITQFGIPVDLNEKISHKLTSLFDEHEFLDFEEIKKNIDKINSDYAIECFRNVMYLNGINMKISLEQALDTVREHFIESIHNL